MYATRDNLAGPIPAPYTTRFVVRSDELLNSKYGRSATGAERPILIPSYYLYGYYYSGAIIAAYWSFHGGTMGVTWTPTEVNMGHEGKNASAGLPRDFHGSPMEVLWKSDGNPMEVSWESYGSPMEAGSIMEAPWKHHGSTTEANGSPDCKHYGSTMETRLRHNGTMEIPWRHHESPCLLYTSPSPRD